MNNRLKAVLFDLDGTLLPMDQEVFTKTYFKFLISKVQPLGYDAKELIDAVWKGTGAMVMNTGELTNEEVFWKVFPGIIGEDAVNDKVIFDEFYRNEFNLAQSVCGRRDDLDNIIKSLKKMGLKVILSSNPIFPQTAQENRMRWAGLDPGDFEYITSYENSHYCKPNPAYFTEISDKIGFSPEECLVVGNDVTEDMVAETTGMNVFLITDCMINKEGKDISCYPGYSFDKLLEHVRTLV